MTLGARRGELCALRREHVDLGDEVLALRQGVTVGPDGTLVVVETKTHQQRRVVLDHETAQVLSERRTCGENADMAIVS